MKMMPSQTHFVGITKREISTRLHNEKGLSRWRADNLNGVGLYALFIFFSEVRYPMRHSGKKSMLGGYLLQQFIIFQEELYLFQGTA